MKTERHGYKFTNKMNTRGGIISTILSVLSVVTFIFGVVISFKNEGNAGIIVGAIGSAVFIINTLGLITGLRSFKEKDSFYLFSWIGTIANGLMWVSMCLIIAAGFMSV